MPSVDNLLPDEENASCEPATRQIPSPSYHPSFAGACEDDGRSIQDARDFLRTGADTDAQLSEDSSAERTRQQACLIRLLEHDGWRVSDADIQTLPILSNKTSEHDVRFASQKCLVKTTWAGWYGQVPVFLDGKLRRSAATPAQYLERTSLFNEVFKGNVRLLGICTSNRPSLVIGEPAGQPSIVVSQPLYEAADPEHPSPTLEVIDQFTRSLDFVPVRDAYFGWVRLADGIAVTDAKQDNFILTAKGIVPIDLQVTQLDPVHVREVVVS